MKKYIFFPLWKIESLEEYLESMEQKGYRLDNISYSHCFSFKESTPKQMNYFLSIKSFSWLNMGCCDYALESRHNANQIKSKMCFFAMYRTKEQKEKLSLLYEARMDYIKRILLEKALTELFLSILYAVIIISGIITSSINKGIWIIGVIPAICFCLTVYHFFGYIKQKNKCKNYEHNNLNR